MPVEVTGRYEKLWKPHKVQEEFIKLPFSIFEALYGGAAGGGKSELLLMLPVLYGWHDVPGFQGILFRKTFPQLEESLIPRSHGFYKHLSGKYNDTKHFWTFPSGARIYFGYLENDEDARDHDTAEFQFIGFDELTAIPSSPNFSRYLYMTSRVRSSIPGVTGIVRSATNPGNVGHMWVRERFVEPAPDGRKIIHDLASDTKRVFIPAKLTDNPYLLAADPGYLKRLNLLPEADRRAKVHGDWWVFAGQVFTEWRDPFAGTKFKDEPSNACHVVEDFEPPSWWPRIIAADWGYSAKTWVGWGAVSPDSRLFLYREYCVEKKSIEDWGSDVKRMSQYELTSFRKALLDPSAWGKRGEQKTLAEQITDATQIKWEKADNDRLGGKMWMHEMLRWKQKPVSYIPEQGFSPETFQTVLRNSGPAAAADYFDLFQPETAEINIPKLQVMRRCKEFRKVIPSCVYDDKKGELVEDVKEFNGDDPYDGGRYLLKGFEGLIKEAVKKGNELDRLGKIIAALEKTGDWNRYFRQMHAYEKNTHVTAGVHRGRRRGVHFVAH